MTEKAVRSLVAARSEALEALDASRFLATYAADAAIFDLSPPLVHGLDPEGVAAWMRSWNGPVKNEVQLLMVSSAGDLAYAAGLERLAGKQGGEVRDIWFRFTLCFVRTTMGWRITHEHTSLPVRKIDGRLLAVADLSP